LFTPILKTGAVAPSLLSRAGAWCLLFGESMPQDAVNASARKILTLFGTRPEVIKLAPVIRELQSSPDRFITCNVSSSQHTDLLAPLIRDFGIRLDHDLKVMQPNQTLSSLASRVLAALDPVLVQEKPDAVLVQGDTTTALAGALAAFYRQIPVGHVEAGLRSGNRDSPFPEEMNRQMITRIATWHFASTVQNQKTLLSEGIPADRVFLTGNPVVDALLDTVERAKPSESVADLLQKTDKLDRILLTTHRRESFGTKMSDNLKVLLEFVRNHTGTTLIFPMHPNPSVSGPAREILGDCERVHLIPPLDYQQFVLMMSKAWLIVSDSGGVQEEAPTLGKALLVLRENTERPEAVEAGTAKLVGQPEQLKKALEEALSPSSWTKNVKSIGNPFGDGTAAAKIVAALGEKLPVVSC
jgi:UDP-N-acetylglucosamine 2-epimerase (non-hydrolysing)